MTANDVTRLLQHYVDKSRPLPWRSPPGTPPPDAYRVWLSEIMLQQTTVATVTPRFVRFVERWPTVAALAAASDEAVLGEWAGLGYYARARNLIACARTVAERGGFPRSARELRDLPGIGAYTAAAIAAIAFGEPAPAVDTNIFRVLARYHGLARPSRSEIERRMAALVDKGPPGDVVQAVMDLGATICRARAPRCGECPLSGGCAALATGDAAAIPMRSVKAERPHRHGTAWWIERDGALWLVRRPRRGLLGGMAALPASDWGEASAPASGAMAIIRHGFTHFTLDLAIVPATDPIGEGWWQPMEAIREAGFPTLFRRAVDAVLAARDAPSPDAVRGRLEEAPGEP